MNPAYAKLPLGEMFGWAYDGFVGKKLDLARDETIAKLRDFTHDRLRGLVASATSNAVADAVLAGGASDFPAYVLARANALHRAVGEGRAWLEKARTVAKRLSGISKESKPVLHEKSALEKADDMLIVDLVAALDSATRELRSEDAVTAALSHAEKAAQQLDEIFTRTLVNDPADARTPKRLELLSFGAQCMLRIADFTKLA